MIKRLSLIFSFLLMAAFVSAQAQTGKPGFKEDAELEKYVVEDARRAVDYAEEIFAVKLDGSEASIAGVEQVLAALHTLYREANPKPDEKQVSAVAYSFGSYVGEVYRRHHGGQWGIILWENEKFPGILTNQGDLFWPWMRTLKRVVNGPDENVLLYYQLQVKQSQAGLEEDNAAVKKKTKGKKK